MTAYSTGHGKITVARVERDVEIDRVEPSTTILGPANRGGPILGQAAVLRWSVPGAKAEPVVYIVVARRNHGPGGWQFVTEELTAAESGRWQEHRRPPSFPGPSLEAWLDREVPA